MLLGMCSQVSGKHTSRCHLSGPGPGPSRRQTLRVLKLELRRCPRSLVVSQYSRATPETRWLVSSLCRDHRIEFDMVQYSTSPHELRTREFSSDADHQVLLFPTRPPAEVSTFLPVQSASRQVPRRRVRAQISTRTIRDVTIVGVSGRLEEVVQDLDQAIQRALGEEPRGVVCDLSAALEVDEPVAVEVLATVGRHVRDWPGIPVGVACPDRQVREALLAHRLGRHLIVAQSLFSVMSAVLATATLRVARLQLAPHPTAPRACRDFVTHTLHDLHLDPVVPFARLVVSEMVISSSVHAGTDIDLSVAWNLDALRLTVRDHGPALGGQQDSGVDLEGRGLTVVAGLSRAFGVLPAANGGKALWAVLDAPRRLSSTSRHPAASQRQEALVPGDARVRTERQPARIIEKGPR